MTTSDPREDLYLGRYGELVALFVDRPGIAVARGEETVAAIGALSFLGRLGEAEALFAGAVMPTALEIEARFFLAIALRRHHRSAEARALLGENLRAGRAVPTDARAQFFVRQGIGFHRYADGRVRAALHWAERAYEAAFKSGFVYGRVLALDLKAHAQINAGAVHAGFASLAAAVKLATAMGQGGVAQAAEVTMTLYRSTLGYGGAAILGELDAAIKRCAFEDSYTLASLYLERSRLALLCGRLSEARRAIEDASQWVYGLDHPILESLLSLRMATVAVHRGDTAQALSLVRAALRRLAATIDIATEAHALGMEHALLRRAGRHAEAERLVPRLEALRARGGSALVARQNDRALMSRFPRLVRHGEDPLGDLLDDVARRGSGAVPDLLEAGFYGLLPQALGLAPDVRTVVFGLAGESVTVFDAGDIRHDAGGWPELARRLLFHLARGESSKEDIVRAVWAQSYHPLRHDPLIYALVARLRRLLEPQDDWLEVGENGYRLRRGVVVTLHWSEEETAPGDALQSSAPADAVPEGLTLRQAGLLKMARSQGALTNRVVCDAFKISDVTASRDLADLVTRGYLQRSGRGRSTAYVLKDQQGESHHAP